jgi:hypothetical protein
MYYIKKKILAMGGGECPLRPPLKYALEKEYIFLAPI